MRSDNVTVIALCVFVIAVLLAAAYVAGQVGSGLAQIAPVLR